jgi:hypothetical protein
MRTPFVFITLFAATLMAAPVAAQQPLPELNQPPSASELEKGTTDAETALLGRPVVSSDGKELGIVSRVLTGEDGELIAIYAAVGEFLGIGERQVQIETHNFVVDDDQVMLMLTESDVLSLPDVREAA